MKVWSKHVAHGSVMRIRKGSGPATGKAMGIRLFIAAGGARCGDGKQENLKYYLAEVGNHV